MGRGLIADPEIPKKLACSRVDEIRPCIRGNEGCTRVDLSLPIRCEVNPACGREIKFRIIPASKKKRVMVIGGGVAGMEAARIAALRDHEVTIVEKSDRIGGHLIEASAPRFKSLHYLLSWMEREVGGSNIKVELNTEATPTLVKQKKPDVLIIAVGSDFIVPSVLGLNKPSVVMAKDILLGHQKPGSKVVVIGGGLVGCETALYIAEELEKKVTIIARRDEILIDQEPLSKVVLKERLEESGVEIYTGWDLTEINDDEVVCLDKNWRIHKVTADTVVIAKGLVSRRELVERFKGLTPEIYVIGDCAEARKIYHAFEDAWQVALQI
jgi:2-enoate reductase